MITFTYQRVVLDLATVCLSSVTFYVLKLVEFVENSLIVGLGFLFLILWESSNLNYLLKLYPEIKDLPTSFNTARLVMITILRITNCT